MTDDSGLEVIVYRDHDDEWRWRLRDAGNHEVIGDSAEGYEGKGWAIHMATDLYPGAKLIVVDEQERG